MYPFQDILLYTLVPIILSTYIIVSALWPHRFIRASRRDFFTRYRYVWLALGILLLLGNLVNLYLRLY